jgi:hypothetical protein
VRHLLKQWGVFAGFNASGNIGLKFGSSFYALLKQALVVKDVIKFGKSAVQTERSHNQNAVDFA